MKKNVFLLTLIFAMVVTTWVSAYAGDSLTVYISKDQTASWSGFINGCTGRVEFDAWNYSSSQRKMWAELYIDNDSSILVETLIDPGYSANRSGTMPYKTDAELCLDPQGWQKSGCSGKGILYD